MTSTKQIIVNELYKPVRRNFTRRPTIVKGVNDLWQIDLAEVQPYAKVNRGMRYILVVIDCCSKFLWTRPVKTKNAKDVTKAMASVLAQGQVPRHIQSDKGREWYNSKFQALMKKYNINHYSTHSVVKASMAERVIRTLKERLYKAFHLQGSYRWLKLLPTITNEYNHSIHSTTGKRPVDVNSDNEREVVLAIAKKRRPRTSHRIKFNRGDIVRISREKMLMEKGYTPRWTTELFRVREVCNTLPVTYLLEDLSGAPIQGCFYTEELQQTVVPDDYLVEKVLRKRGNQLLIKWLGLKEPSWIPAANIIK